MASTPIPPPLHSPGLACGRRKGPKNFPKLPLSAFSPPNTGTSDTFPLPPTASAVIPTGIIDSHLRVPESVEQYREVIGQLVLEKIRGVVLTADTQPSDDIPGLLQGLRSRFDVPILAVSIPFALDKPPPSQPPSYLSGSNPSVTLSTTLTHVTPEAVSSLTWALSHSDVVDIDIQADMMAGVATSGPSLYDSFEDLLTKATITPPRTDGAQNKRAHIVLSNIFPPPLDLDQPIVKIMQLPEYLQYQSRVSSLSLFENLQLKITPPVRQRFGTRTESTDSLKEWKSRLKLYIGPVLEAFGFERMLFGSSPSPAGEAFDLPVSWYDLVRESFAELGVEQDAIDNVFMHNAKRVYGRST